MFSARVAADLRPNRLAQALEARRRAGAPILDLTLSNPTRAGLEYPPDLLVPLADRRGLIYEPAPLGLEEARAAVAREFARRGRVVDPHRIALVASTSEAYSLLFKLLADPGDEVLVPRPSYPLLEYLTALDAVIARPYDLEYHGVWSIDLAALEAAVGPRTRAVVVVHPNNPTGSFVSAAEADRLERLCRDHGMAVIADEVFADYVLEPDARPASPAAGRGALAFALGGLSKSVGLPQAKLAWIAVDGPDDLVERAIARLELICDTYLSVSTAVQLAAPRLLEQGATVRGRIAGRISANYERLKELSRAAPASRVLRADGGWYAILQVPAFEPEEDLVVGLLARDGVLVHPGYFFDFPGGSHLVLSLLPPEETFAKAVSIVMARSTRGG